MLNSEEPSKLLRLTRVAMRASEAFGDRAAPIDWPPGHDVDGMVGIIEVGTRQLAAPRAIDGVADTPGELIGKDPLLHSSGWVSCQGGRDALALGRRVGVQCARPPPESRDVVGVRTRNQGLAMQGIKTGLR
jgi:hypothetical protein